MQLQFQYLPLCTLSLYHAYYGGRRAADCYLQPTPETARLANVAGIVIKQTGEGLQLAFDSSAKERLQIQWLTPKARLSFFLYTSNPYFVNITDMPFQIDRALLMDNQKPFLNEKGSMLLHPSPFLGEANAHRRVAGTWVLDGVAENEGPVTISHPGSESVLRQVPFRGKAFEASFGGLPIGGYAVRYGQKEQLVAYVGPSITPYPMGIVDIYPTPELRKQVEEPSKKGVHYAVEMATRQTYWQYVVVKKHATSLDSIYISDGVSDSLFAFKEKRVVGSGEAMVFESKQTLPLLERQATTFQLKSKQGKGVEITHLPIASAKQIRVEAQKLYSEIFVYV